MRPLLLDKIASVTRNCALRREVRVGDEFPCKEGDVVAVRVLNQKNTYNELELVTGRMSLVKKGDLVAGALGHRNALGGYAGHLPERLAVGDTVNLLNLGGVLGMCDSFNPSVGRPFECEVLGQVLHFPVLGERIGVPANIGRDVPPPVEDLDAEKVPRVPMVMVVGTCMNSGKTFACASLIQELAREKLSVAAFKATGVSLRRDVLVMEDAGATLTMVFTDLGIVTTTEACAPGLARTMYARLAAQRPDLVVCELGDGIMGTYGVHSILADAGLRGRISALVLAANDPVGAWGGVRRLAEEYRVRPTVLTGPCTDNVAGTRMIEQTLDVPARNARTDPAGLAEVVRAALKEAREP